ncbi:surfeit locus protein 1 [Anoplophora glabripennis]|uniref:surfeit locus protein 1 n=1 Tax=Anoplophora glabripennis TaxID=217634 RepID=UPI000874503E|nr:surfeit locus protein 1 [Anoplophora glabripennis]
MNFIYYRLFKFVDHKVKCTFNFNRSYWTTSAKFQSFASKSVNRSPYKFRSIPPTGWFLLIIPISTFSLGVWQVQRKKWKENLIIDLQTKTGSDPVPLPESLEDIYKLEYQPVYVKGTFLHDKELYIGPRSLLLKGDASTQSTLVTSRGNSSHGYLVITPFKLVDRNELILVNRGWVPTKKKDPSRRHKGQTEGIVDVVGLVRLHENRPTFIPKNEEGSNTYFYRDLHQLSAATGSLPVLLDATNEFDVPEGPIGGQTRISLRNEHLSYILTWFSLSGATSFMWYKRFFK